MAGDHITAKFVKDSSKFWYKPHILREDGECFPKKV